VGYLIPLSYLIFFTKELYMTKLEEFIYDQVSTIYDENTYKHDAEYHQCMSLIGRLLEENLIYLNEEN